MTPSITDQINQLLDEAQEREKDVTPGPWSPEENVKAGGVLHFAVTARHEVRDWMPCSITPQTWVRDVDKANAAFIASSRTDLPRYRSALRLAVEFIESLRSRSDMVCIHADKALTQIHSQLMP